MNSACSKYPVPTHRPPTHPGEVLREEFLAPFEISAQELARRIHVPESPIEALTLERGRVTPDLALRLARVFGTSAEFWLNGQLVWELYHAMHAPAADEIASIAPLGSSAAFDG